MRIVAVAGGRTGRSRTVPDVLFVLVTVGLFAGLALVLRAVERL